MELDGFDVGKIFAITQTSTHVKVTLRVPTTRSLLLFNFLLLAIRATSQLITRIQLLCGRLNLHLF